MNPKDTHTQPHFETHAAPVVSAERVRELEEQLALQHQKVAALTSRMSELERENMDLYSQRTMLVAGLAKCFPSGIRRTDIPDWHPEWHGCCYINLPAGQISFHYHNRDAHYFHNFPAYAKPFDGHTKREVEIRIGLLRTGDESAWIKPWLDDNRKIARDCMELRAHEANSVLLWQDNVEKLLLSEAIARARGTTRDNV